MTDGANNHTRPAAQSHGAKRAGAKKSPLVLTPRDVAILRDLFDSRLLTARQIADIHFNSSRNAAKQRLWALSKALLIAARFAASPFSASATQPQPLRLTRAGFELLRERGAIDDYPRLTWNAMSVRLKVSRLTLNHELDVGLLKAAIHREARRRGDTTVNVIITWPRLLRFRVRPGTSPTPVNVSPDGFARLTHGAQVGTPMQTDFFLENDRSTETLSRIVERAAAYVAYYTTGGYAKRQGIVNAEAKDFPFRVLWTFPTLARLEGFAKACREHRPPIRKMMWCATLTDATRDPLGPIWRRPVDQADERHPLLPSVLKASTE